MYRIQRLPENAQQRGLEELVACNQTGKFERFGERDIAFVCDFCDGHLVWEDLREMPSSRQPTHDGLDPMSATSTTPATQDNWQAVGFKASDGEEKNVAYAPLVVANHMPPEPGDWQARILCPYCDDYYTEEQGEDDMEQVKWNQDEGGFEDVTAFTEHLAWTHVSVVSVVPKPSNCAVM